MSLPQFSVRRPIFTTMVTLIVVILGAVSLSRLQIDRWSSGKSVRLNSVL